MHECAITGVKHVPNNNIFAANNYIEMRTMVNLHICVLKSDMTIYLPF